MEMRKIIFAMTMVALVVQNAQAGTHEKVQLWEGGPYWATTNIGAENPEDYGLYFWWGDTTGHSPSGTTFAFSFDESNCPTSGKGLDTLLSEEWIVPGTNVLAPAHDAAHVQWGGGWRMPTFQELMDLCSYCDWTWTTMSNGVNGYVIRGRGTYAFNSIFLPAAGRGHSNINSSLNGGNGSSLVNAGSIGLYSTSTAHGDNWYVDKLVFSSSSHGVSFYSWQLTREEGIPVRPVQGAIVSFNANGGTETMEAQTFEAGKKQKLSKNLFKKDGYVFQGWAETENGIVKYTDEQESTFDRDTTLYAVWDNPPLTITAESADWSSGSITLRCEDADKSGAEHTYSLEYCNENGTWVAVDDAQVSVAKGQNANDEEVWVVRLTDSAFSSRLGGIPPVQYHVKETKSGRVSEPCVTRSRHGIFVGVGDLVEDANSMNKLAIDNGGFSGENIRLLTSPSAKYNDVKNAFEGVALKTKDKPGDICVIYFSTHGGRYGNTTIGRLVLDERPPVSEDPREQGYHEGLLAKHIRSLDPDKKGVGVVCIISACYSGAFLDDDNGLKECNEVTSWCHREDLGENVAWITAASAATSSSSLFDKILLEYGWKKGWAMKGKNGNKASFFDLWEYASKQYDPIAQKSGLSGCEKRKEQILRNVVAGTIASSPDTSLQAPGKPIELSATKNRDDVVRVSWSQGSGGDPDWYFVIRKRKDTNEFENIIPTKECSTNIPEIASHAHPMQYAVAAFNGAGVDITDGFEDGWRTIDVYRATFYYDLPVGVRYHTDRYVTPFIQAGSTLLPELKAITEIVSGWNRDRLEFRGWKTRSTDSLFVVWRDNGNWVYPAISVNADLEYHAIWATDRTYGMTQNWLGGHNSISTASNGDIAMAAAMTAANGCRTVGECYALGIDPEDPFDDFRITAFRNEDGQPVITVNHTTDGSGNSFADRIRTLGKKSLIDADWVDVTDTDQSEYRFFKVSVELDDGDEGVYGGR